MADYGAFQRGDADVEEAGLLIERKAVEPIIDEVAMVLGGG